MKHDEPYTLKRKERIKMFLYEYYFGQYLLITLSRLTAGPLLIFLGVIFYQRIDKFDVAYGGVLFFFGIYYFLQPLFWILFRYDSFATVDLNIKILEDRIALKDTFSESEIMFEGINKILKRKFYFALELAKYNKVYIPFSILTGEQISILNQIASK